MYRLLTACLLIIAFPNTGKGVPILPSDSLYSNFTKVYDEIHCVFINYILLDENLKFDNKEGFSCRECQYNVKNSPPNDFRWRLPAVGGYIELADRIDVKKQELRGNVNDSKLYSDNYAHKLWRLLDHCWLAYKGTLKYNQEVQKEKNKAKIQRDLYEHLMALFERGIQPWQARFPKLLLPLNFKIYQTKAYWDAKFIEFEGEQEFQVIKKHLEDSKSDIIAIKDESLSLSERKEKFIYLDTLPFKIENTVEQLKAKETQIETIASTESDSEVKAHIQSAALNIKEWEDELAFSHNEITLELEKLRPTLGSPSDFFYLWVIGILMVALLGIGRYLLVSKNRKTNRQEHLPKKRKRKKRYASQEYKATPKTPSNQILSQKEGEETLEILEVSQEEPSLQNDNLPPQNKSPQESLEQEPHLDILEEETLEEPEAIVSELPEEPNSESPIESFISEDEEIIEGIDEDKPLLPLLTFYFPLNVGRESYLLDRQKSHKLKPNSFLILSYEEGASDAQLSIVDSSEMHKKIILHRNHQLTLLRRFAEFSSPKKNVEGRFQLIMPGQATKAGDKWKIVQKIKLEIV